MPPFYSASRDDTYAAFVTDFSYKGRPPLRHRNCSFIKMAEVVVDQHKAHYIPCNMIITQLLVVELPHALHEGISVLYIQEMVHNIV